MNKLIYTILMSLLGLVSSFVKEKLPIPETPPAAIETEWEQDGNDTSYDMHDMVLSNIWEDYSFKEYSGEVSIVLKKDADFSAGMFNPEGYESYADLDLLGRCGTAFAIVGIDTMPTKERGAIGHIKPSGWHQKKYEGIVSSDPPYLYNRCHLIGYQMTGQNDNPLNLITGTCHFNVDGMEPYENDLAAYVRKTGNHVAYRVTPLFKGKDLVATAVLMEAVSVEDNGKFNFRVIVYNIQPGIVIDYTTGESEVE